MRMRKQKKVKRKFPIFLSEFSRAERWRDIFLEWVKWRTLRLLLRHKQSSCDETFYLHFTLILGSFKCHCIACRLVSVFSFCAGRWWNRERNEWIPAAEKKGRISYRFSTYLTFVSSPEGLGTDLDIKLKCTMSIKCSIGIHPIVFSHLADAAAAALLHPLNDTMFDCFINRQMLPATSETWDVCSSSSDVVSCLHDVEQVVSWEAATNGCMSNWCQVRWNEELRWGMDWNFLCVEINCVRWCKTSQFAICWLCCE